MSSRPIRWALTFIVAVGAAVFGLASPLADGAPAGEAAAAASGGSPPWPCLALVQPKLTSQVPGDTPLNDQASLNCFAWQEFIALNWPAAPEGGGMPARVGPADFGKSGSFQPVVWETFMDIHEIMTPDGSKPAKWGTPPEVPAACRALGHKGLRPLVRTSKVSVEFDAPTDVDEAFPHPGPDWLADRKGNPVLYEILVDEPEYDFIVDNGFYNARTQYEKVSAGTHVDLPEGRTGGSPGAIEIKAAWLMLPETADPNAWSKYKLSEAYIHNDTKCRKVTVALVGMHILHKTQSNPQWVWATFEHVDNAPDQQAVGSSGFKDDYTFYQRDCKPRQYPAECQTLSVDDCKAPKKAPLPKKASRTGTSSCAPNTAPAYCLDLFNPECPPYPIQVTRLTPIPNAGDNLIQDLNANVRALIRQQAGESSVWQYYQLVGVHWSGAPVDENLPGTSPPQTPLAIAGMRPDPVPQANGNAQPVANTMLETYIQTTACTACHRGAQLAWPSNEKSNDKKNCKPFASDYSFVFMSAHSSGSIDCKGGGK